MHHSFIRSFVHSFTHSFMHAWMDGWMDGCIERERERTCNRHVKFLRMFCFAFDNTLGARYFKDVSHQLHVNVFSYECLGCSFLNHVQRIYTYPNLSRVTTFRHLVGTLVATCHLSGDMFCPDWWCCHFAQHVFDCFCMHCVTWLSDRLPRYTGYGMSTGQPQVEHQTLLVAVAEHRDSITICQLV